jgi:hypothetical protein
LLAFVATRLSERVQFGHIIFLARVKSEVCRLQKNCQKSKFRATVESEVYRLQDLSENRNFA